MPDSRDWSVYFTVAELQPGRALVAAISLGHFINGSVMLRGIKRRVERTC